MASLPTPGFVHILSDVYRNIFCPLPLFTFALLKASLQYLLLLTGFHNMSHVRHSLSKLHRAQRFLFLQGGQMDVIMWFHTAWLSGVVGARGTVAHWGQRRGWQERFGQEWCGGCARDGIQRADHPQGCCAKSMGNSWKSPLIKLRPRWQWWPLTNPNVWWRP